MTNKEPEIWRYGFKGMDFGLMKDGPYVLLEQIEKSHREAIAKKDAALKACVEALRTCSENIDYEMFYDKDAVTAAIAQAKEAGAPAAPILDHASIEGMDDTAGLPPILKRQTS